MSDGGELLGLWDSEPFDYGSMEDSQLAFLADGSGWGLWRNAGGGMELTTFEWARVATNRFVVTGQVLFSGTWHRDHPGCMLCDSAPESISDEEFQFQILPSMSPISGSRDPLRALMLDNPFNSTRSYAFGRGDIVHADRPRVVTPPVTS